MNIGIDIDDTITFTYETLIPMIAISYGLNIRKLLNQKPSYKMLEKTLPNYENFALNNFSTMAKMVPLRDGVVSILNKLREDGHRIIFITARNYVEYDDPYKLSKDYLDKNNIPYDKLLVNVKDKGRECILEKIDLFIDDNTNNCKAVKRKGIDTWQFDTVFTEKIEGIDRVDSWEEVYKRIQEMYV